MNRASLFSFNNTGGVCPHCTGLGTVLTSTRELLIKNPDLSFENGALCSHKSLKFYSDPYGQYIATLKAVGEKRGMDFSLPVRELSDEAVNIALYGAGKKSLTLNGILNVKTEREHIISRGSGLDLRSCCLKSTTVSTPTEKVTICSLSLLRYPARFVMEKGLILRFCRLRLPD
jgi:excinuclease UvrABC ATPase subunit